MVIAEISKKGKLISIQSGWEKDGKKKKIERQGNRDGTCASGREL